MTSITDTEKWRGFLETYKKLTVLWQLNNESYKSKFLRNKAWNCLLKKFHEIDPGASVDKLKQRINNIRSCYRRELRKVQTYEKQSPDDVYTPSLWYFNILEFLKDQEMPQKKPTTVNFVIHRKRFSIKQDVQTNAPPVKRVPEVQAILEAPVSPTPPRVPPSTPALAPVSIPASGQRDDAAVHADSWACSFRQLTREQQLYAKRAIDEILLLGQLERLTYNSVAPGPAPVNATISCSDAPFPTIWLPRRSSLTTSQMDQSDSNPI